jgi:hypothetical protein
MHHNLVSVAGAVALAAALALPAKGFGQLPPAGYYSSAFGVQLDGRQCVPSGRDLARALILRDLPAVGKDGGAADIWSMDRELDRLGWRKIPNDGRQFPPARAAMIIWGSQLAGSGGKGHIAFCNGIVDPQNRIARVTDSNWFVYRDGTPRGAIHDVPLNGAVLGWIVPK